MSVSPDFLIPRPGEFNDFYRSYIEEMQGEHPLEALESDLKQQMDLLDRSPGLDLNYRYQADKWSLSQLIIHLIDTERIMSCRALAAQRLDSIDYPGYNYESYVAASETDERNWYELRKDWSAVRGSTRSLFHSFGEEDWEKSVLIDGEPLSGRALLNIVCGHNRVHFKTIQAKYLP